MQRERKQVVNLACALLLVAFCAELFPSSPVQASTGPRRRRVEGEVKNSGYVCYSSIYSLLYHDSASLAWMHLCLKTAIKKLSDVVGRRLDSHKVDERNGAEKPIASMFLLACPFGVGMAGATPAMRN